MLPAQPLLANCKFEGIWRCLLPICLPKNEIAGEIVPCGQAKRAISTAQDYHPNVWSNSSSGIGSAPKSACVHQRFMRCYDLQVCFLDRLQPDAFMQERTQACPAQRWQFHTPHAQPWRSWHVRPARMVRFPQQFRSLGDKSAKCIAK